MFLSFFISTNLVVLFSAPDGTVVGNSFPGQVQTSRVIKSLFLSSLILSRAIQNHSDTVEQKTTRLDSNSLILQTSASAESLPQLRCGPHPLTAEGGKVFRIKELMNYLWCHIRSVNQACLFLTMLISSVMPDFYLSLIGHL